MKQHDLAHDKLSVLLTNYIFSSIVSMLISAVHQIIDTVYIGRCIGSEGLAAVNIVMPVISWSWAFIILFATGGSTLFAIELGKENTEKGLNYFYITIFVTVLIDVVIMFAGLFFISPLCMALGCTNEALPYAIPYLKTQLYFVPVISFNAIMSRFAGNDKNPQVVSYSAATAAVTNIVLNYVFIVIYKWSMMGASLATGLAQTAGAFVLASHFSRKNISLNMKLRNFRGKASALFSISKTGFPSFLAEGSFAFTLVFFNRAIREFAGTEEIAAMGIMFTLINFLYLMINGVAAATQPIISYNHGAGNYERVWKTLNLATLVALGIGILTTIGGELCAEFMVRLINNTDEGLIALTAKVCRINFFTMPITAISGCVQVYYQSINKTFSATLLTVLRNAVFVLICLFILKNLFGLNGVWLTYPVSDIMSATMYLVCFFKIRKDCNMKSLQNQRA